MATATTTTSATTPGVIVLQQGITRKVAAGTAAKEACFRDIPTIDVARMYSDSLADRQALAAEVREACTKIGFMQIAGHGIDWAVVDTAFDGIRDFFALPLEAKMEVYQHKSKHFLGYEPLYYTNVNMLKKGDRKEAFSFAYSPDIDPDNVPDMPELLIKKSIWPAESTIPGFRSKVIPYQQALIRFARRFCRIFALALDLPEDFFDKKTTHPMAGVRSLHYPPMDGPEDEETSLGAHTDIEFFTIIAQTATSSPALEVLNADGEWIAVTPKPQCFVVNLADMFMRMTNDTFVSTVHRVVNRNQEDRYSLPFFFGVNSNELIEVLPSCTSKEHPAKYGPLTTFEHSNKRLRVARYQHPNAKEMLVTCPKELITKDGVRLYA